ncbi:MAG: outer membrane protein assembly factor BamB [Pseudomonadota bacterium]|jgi:outer membrane assembly lipoprotein YfgL
MSLTSRISSELMRACGVVACAVAALGLSACGASKPSPSPLEKLQPGVALSVLWSHRVDTIEGPMSLAVAGDTLVSASSDGDVQALRVTDGAPVWRLEVRSDLSALVGSDGRYVAVVTQSNDLLVFDREAQTADKPVWQERQPGRVLTAPLVAGERVFVEGVDRSVRAYDLKDGRWLWQYQRPGGEPLALGASVVLSPFKDTLLTAQGSRLVGLDPTKGAVRFDVNVGSPRGTNEVERLADLVAPLARAGGDTGCARVFQLSVACLDLSKGSVLWSRPQAGMQAVAASTQLVVGSDGADRLTAWKVDGGDFAWRVDRFTYRGLSAPAMWRDKVAVADRDGYVHLLNAADGSTAARIELDSAPATAPRVVQDKLIVVTRKGTVYALAVN